MTRSDAPPPEPIPSDVTEFDDTMLRRAFLLARDVDPSHGLPFAALIARADEPPLGEGCNSQRQDRDGAAHAAMNVVRRVSLAVPRERLAGATLYASSEPCAMCTTAIFYAGIRRIVFGASDAAWRRVAPFAAEIADLGLSCRDVAACAAAPVGIAGPCREGEALAAINGPA